VLLSFSGLLGVVSNFDSSFNLKCFEASRGGHGSTHTLSGNQNLIRFDHMGVINVQDAIRDDCIPLFVTTVGHVCRNVNSYLLFCSSGVHFQITFEESQEFDVFSSERFFTVTVDDMFASLKHDCHPGER